MDNRFFFINQWYDPVRTLTVTRRTYQKAWFKLDGKSCHVDLQTQRCYNKKGEPIGYAFNTLAELNRAFLNA